MYKILSCTASCDSAMKLRDAIEEILGFNHKDILVSKDSSQCSGFDVLLRYGCGYGRLKTEPEWNSPKFINTCIDKRTFSRLFRGIVPVPVFHENGIPNSYPVLVRETLTGAKSEGVHLVHNRQEFDETWQNGFYWTEFFHADFELRVLLALSKNSYDLRIYKKEPVDGKSHHDEFIVEGDNTNWRLKDAAYYPKAVSTVEKMIPKIYELGGRFCGIDVLYVPSRKEYVVLELNSGPWLTLPAAKWLAGLFVKFQWEHFK